MPVRSVKTAAAIAAAGILSFAAGSLAQPRYSDIDAAEGALQNALVSPTQCARRLWRAQGESPATDQPSHRSTRSRQALRCRARLLTDLQRGRKPHEPGRGSQTNVPLLESRGLGKEVRCRAGYRIGHAALGPNEYAMRDRLDIRAQMGPTSNCRPDGHDKLTRAIEIVSAPRI